jgi:hypothetical protein
MHQKDGQVIYDPISQISLYEINAKRVRVSDRTPSVMSDQLTPRRFLVFRIVKIKTVVSRSKCDAQKDDDAGSAVLTRGQSRDVANQDE